MPSVADGYSYFKCQQYTRPLAGACETNTRPASTEGSALIRHTSTKRRLHQALAIRPLRASIPQSSQIPMHNKPARRSVNGRGVTNALSQCNNRWLASKQPHRLGWCCRGRWLYTRTRAASRSAWPWRGVPVKTTDSHKTSERNLMAESKGLRHSGVGLFCSPQ